MEAKNEDSHPCSGDGQLEQEKGPALPPLTGHNRCEQGQGKLRGMLVSIAPFVSARIEGENHSQRASSSPIPLLP